MMTEVPGPRPAAKRAKTVARCWSLFFTDGMLETIVTHTNDKIRSIVSQLENAIKSDKCTHVKETSVEEILSFSFNNVQLKYLFNPVQGHHVYS